MERISKSIKAHMKIRWAFGPRRVRSSIIINNPCLINPWLILINPCRARGVPREPRSQEGLLDERLAVRRGVIFVPWALLGPKKRFWIDLSTSSKISIFWTLSKINKNGVAVRLVRILAALGAPKSKKSTPTWAPKATFVDPKTVTMQHDVNLHRNTNYTMIPLIFCFIWSSTKYMFVVFVS